MTLRNASGRFNLPSFGRRNHDNTTSPASSRNPSGSYPAAVSTSGGNGFGNGNESDSLSSPRAESHGTGVPGLDGLGRKIGKSIAHTSLIPALGNQDLRALQDVISTEKGVLQMADRFATETQVAASKLPVYGQQEGPDLQDILTHSSTLLGSLATAIQVFTQHQSEMRVCYKRIREREEQLDQLRRRRRSTGQKAEQAERKLAKMGPENKQLPQQTELLERLRIDMRQMDSDIITDESKLGDFKRQVIKEALSLKFGGLEELGEKMCIIGELGKLLLEEIPLEETPPGYGRAPYTAYDRTENTVKEATKCLATVQFHAGSAAPKPPGLPLISDSGSLRAPSLPRHGPQSIADAEEFANYPGNAASPDAKTTSFAIDENPYGGMTSSYHPSLGAPIPSPLGGPGAARYAEYGATEAPTGSSQVVWQGPSDEALHADQVHDAGPSYEYEQQRQMDAAAAAAGAPPTLYNPHDAMDRKPSWEPLNLKREKSGIPDGAGANLRDAPYDDSLSPPPVIGGGLESGRSSTEYDRRGTQSGYFTPEESPNANFSAPPVVPNASVPDPRDYSLTSPVGSSSNGVISAAAFRRGAKPRTSTEPTEVLAYADSPSSPTQPGAIRRLPAPPMPLDGAPSASSGYESPATTGSGEKAAYKAPEEDTNPPPMYEHDEGLR